MADILIPNMELPKACFNDEEHYCPFLCFDYNTDAHCTLSDTVRCTKTRRPKDCPLVELPPHGRLIDADDLASYYADLEADNGEYTENAGETLRTIQNAPTVLEASTEGEETR